MAAPTPHRPTTGSKGRQPAEKAYNNGDRQHNKRKRGSLGTSEQNNGAALHFDTSRTPPSRSSARQEKVPVSGVVHADAKPTTQRGMLSLEEVEKTLCSHSSSGTVQPAAPPSKPLPHASHSQAAADILSMISPPRQHPPPPVTTPSSPALPSPVIGTSEDFPENPPLMVSAGMKSGPVPYTPSKSPPPSSHHGKQASTTGHHSDSEVVGLSDQGKAERRGVRDHVATGDQVGC